MANKAKIKAWLTNHQVTPELYEILDDETIKFIEDMPTEGKLRATLASRDIWLDKLPEYIKFYNIPSYAYYGTEIEEVNVPYGVKEIGYSAFAKCRDLKYVVINDSVEDIGSSAFEECNSLVSIILPESLRILGSFAFFDCDALHQVSFPDSIVEIGQSAFLYCHSLDRIYANTDNVSNVKYLLHDANCNDYVDKVTSIEDELQYNSYKNMIYDKEDNDMRAESNVNNYKDKCIDDLNRDVMIENWMTEHHISKCLYDIIDGVIAFKHTDRWYGSEDQLNIEYSTLGENGIWLDDLPEYIKFSNLPYRAYCGCDIEEIVIPETVHEIGNFAFDGCFNLKNVVMKSSVESIGKYAFNNCTSLINVDISYSVVEIMEGAFSGCTGLKYISLGESITRIDYKLLYDCTSLETIYISGFINDVDDLSFHGCNSLKNIFVKDVVLEYFNKALEKSGQGYLTNIVYNRDELLINDDNEIYNDKIEFKEDNNMERARLDTWEENKFGLSSISCVYHQDPDCEDPEDLAQSIKLETVSNGCSSYINISIPRGGHWSIDDKQDLVNLIDDFLTRFEYAKDEDIVK